MPKFEYLLKNKVLDRIGTEMKNHWSSYVFATFVLILGSTNASIGKSEVPEGELRETILRFTLQYVNLREQNRLGHSWSMYSASTKEVLPLDDYISMTSRFELKTGPLKEFTAWRILQYSEPKVYVVDFSGIYENDHYGCGYFVWKIEQKSLRLLRSQTSHASFEDLQGDKAAELLETLGCHGHSQNFLDKAGFKD